MSSYWKNLGTALLGRAGGRGVGGAADARSRQASLEMDLREKDEKIEQMKREYGSLEASRERAAAGAGQEQIEKLFRKLAGPLSNLSTLAALAESGKDVTAADMANLVRSVEKILAGAGLEPIGRAGQRAEFDIAAHQRMSGGAVSAGTAVTVRIPGYKLGQKVLQKAMVSAEEDSHGEGGH
jgi:molecular chaperone GrpE (heat shock protein)